MKKLFFANSIALILVISGCASLISVPKHIFQGIFDDMDKDNNGLVNYSEYLKAASDDEELPQNAKNKGMTINEYLKWDFDRADTNKDGNMVLQEMIDYTNRYKR